MTEGRRPRWEKPAKPVDVLSELRPLIRAAAGLLADELLEKIEGMPVVRRSTYGECDAVSNLVESAALVLLDVQRVRGEIATQLMTAGIENAGWTQLASLIQIERLALACLQGAVDFRVAMDT